MPGSTELLAPALSLLISKMGAGDSAHGLGLMRSPVTQRCRVSAPMSSGAPRPQMGSPDGKPWKSLPPPQPPAVNTDQVLQSSFTIEPVGYRVPWNSQGHSAGATQPPSSKISPRVTAKAHLTHFCSYSQTFHGSPGPVIRTPSSKLFHH